MQKHPCRICSTKGDCDDCTKPDDYADYADREHDRKRDDAMIEAEKE